MESVSVRIQQNIWKELQAIAERRGMMLSKLLNKILSAYLREQTEKSK
jgi:predicted DNA-binding ribbon-helix-helix protein